MNAMAILLPLSFAQAMIDTTAAWTMKTGGPVYSSPTCDSGFVYIGSDDGNMYCLDGVSGSVLWKFGTGGLIRCTPAIVDTLVYFESDDGNLYAVNKNSGTKIWSLEIGNHINRILPNPNTSYWDYMQSSPCVDSGVVYVGSGDGSLYAVHSSDRNFSRMYAKAVRIEFPSGSSCFPIGFLLHYTISGTI
jgi:outer membrane protein assembly factor BamB